MADYRSMFDYKYIGAWSLQGRDVTVKIRAVRGETLRNKQGADKKAVVYFEGSDKGFAANKTNCVTIAGLYGPDTVRWIGQRITLFPTQTQVGSRMVDCIRVRPEKPAAKAKTEQLDDSLTDDAMRAQQQEAAEHDPETGEVKDDDKEKDGDK